jgi:AraC-like DNA-binding protein/ligand-binding sensor protein
MSSFIQMLTTLNHTISQKVAEVFDLYTELHGVRVSLFGPDKTLLYPDQVGRPNCSYCRMLREELGLDGTCRALDQMMMDAALQENEMIVYTCHAGMREAVAPLILDGQLAGFVMLGQFRSLEAPRQSPYAAQWRREQGNDALQQAFADSAIFPENKIKLLLAMFSQLLDLIFSGKLIHHKDYDLIAPVIEHIRQNLDNPLSLAEAARLSGRSPSTVTRLFKKITGSGFKPYQMACRLQFAADRLTAAPNRPVAKIAAEAGFDDPFYFSRVFHKHTGRSPSEYRNEKRGDV